jgi:hypothetical protein
VGVIVDAPRPIGAVEMTFPGRRRRAVPDDWNRRLKRRRCDAGSAARACQARKLPATLIGKATLTLAAETA